MAWTAPTTQPAGTTITTTIWNTDLTDNLTFLGGTHDHSGDSGDGAAVRRGEFLPPLASGGTGVTDRAFNQYAQTLTADGQVNQAYFVFRCPTTFTSISKLVALINPTSTGNLYRNVAGIASADGEANSGAHSASIANGAVACSNNTLKEDNIIAAVPGAISAGDFLSIVYERLGNDALDTLNTTCGIIGCYVEYS